MRPVVAEIDALEPRLQALSDAALRARTDELRQRAGRRRAELDDLLVGSLRGVSARRRGARCACATSTSSSWAAWCCTPGKIAEMATGEGKTLVATLPAYLNALPGLGTHIVTVNDYLARRDAQWMGPDLPRARPHGGRDPARDAVPLRSGLRLRRHPARRPAPGDPRRRPTAADITYGTNNEFGFDYLRDNMRFSLEEIVQREHHYAIVDEVDSILIDEARTPLIISGPDRGRRAGQATTRRSTGSSRKLKRAATIVEGKLSEIEESAEGDYIVDEKARAVSLTEQGDRLLRAAPRHREPLRPRPHGDRSTTSTRRSRPTPSSTRTWTTWSRTGRWSSWTSSPAA